ncbi:unnamed protein product [Ectocarpus sp. 8 AP-2014]
MRDIQGAKNVTTATGGEESIGREFQHLCKVLQSASGIRDSECQVGKGRAWREMPRTQARKQLN